MIELTGLQRVNPVSGVIRQGNSCDRFNRASGVAGGWHSSGLSGSREKSLVSILSQSSTARSAACISVPPRRHKLARAELYSLRHGRPSRRRQHGVLLFVASRIRPPPLREYASLAQLLRALRLTQLAAVGHVCCLERRCYRANPPPAARVRGERQHTVREARAAAAFRRSCSRREPGTSAPPPASRLRFAPTARARIRKRREPARSE